jgi:hypothetical protein
MLQWARGTREKPEPRWGKAAPSATAQGILANGEQGIRDRETHAVAILAVNYFVRVSKEKHKVQRA